MQSATYTGQVHRDNLFWRTACDFATFNTLCVGRTILVWRSGMLVNAGHFLCGT